MPHTQTKHNHQRFTAKHTDLHPYRVGCPACANNRLGHDLTPTPAPTPGPWIFETIMDKPRDIDIYAKNGGCLICTVTSENADRQETVFADARLIAAAPRMLAFIKAGHCDDDEAAAILKEIQG